MTSIRREGNESMANQETLTKFADVRAKTRFSVDICKFTWSIENFSLYPCKVNEYLTSPSFETGAVTWNLELYPEGETHSEHKVGLYLMKLGPSGEHKAHFTFYIPDPNNVPCHQKHGEGLFKLPGPPLSFGWKCFICRDSLLERREAFLPNDTLTIVCEVKVMTSICAIQSLLKTKNEDAETEMTPGDLQSLSCNLRALYDSKKFSDFILKVDNEELPVHKLVLAARSEVFAAMFEHDKLEKNKDCVLMKDVPIDVLKSMLTYMYSGQMGDLTHELAVDLHAAAEKYALWDLKGKCRRFLSSGLSVDTVCEVVRLAHLNNDAELEKDAECFLLYNSGAVLKTEAWKQLVDKNPSLATKLLQAVAATFDSCDTKPPLDANLSDTKPPLDANLSDTKPPLDANLSDTKPPLDANLSDTKPPLDANLIFH